MTTIAAPEAIRHEQTLQTMAQIIRKMEGDLAELKSEFARLQQGGSLTFADLYGVFSGEVTATWDDFMEARQFPADKFKDI